MKTKKPLKALIVEDNVFMATVLQDLLTQYSSKIAIIDIAKTGNEALSLIAKINPDVIFLDIELPDMTGFELLQQLDNINFQTVFTTSHSHYAIKAFRFNALDYLIKPINESELDEAIKKIYKFTNNSIDVKNALSNRNYSYIHLSNGSKELSSKNLAYFEDILVDKNFYRAHRSFLVNKYHIKELIESHFVLNNKLEIPISRRNITEAKAWFLGLE